LRHATPDDAAACGRICFEAFGAVNDAQGFPRDFPSVDVATDLLRMLLQHPGFYGIVAERDGKIIGSNFLDERATIGGIGPITVDPAEEIAPAGSPLEFFVARPVVWGRLTLSALGQKAENTVNGRCRPLVT
jgi:hypothetical protein